MKSNTPHWSRIREGIEQAGGAWPPPGTREVERAVAAPRPVRDDEHLVAMLLKRRKLMSAVHDGRTRCRAEVREQLMELEKRINDYMNQTNPNP